MSPTKQGIPLSFQKDLQHALILDRIRTGTATRRPQVSQRSFDQDAPEGVDPSSAKDSPKPVRRSS